MLAWAGELKLSASDLLAFTCGDRERAASLRALRTRADTLPTFSGVFSDAGAGALPSFAFSFITCAHAMAMSDQSRASLRPAHNEPLRISEPFVLQFLGR